MNPDEPATSASEVLGYPALMPLPKDLSAFIVELAAQSHLPRLGPTFPTDRVTLRRTAEALARTARVTFGVKLDLKSDDPHQLDRLANAHLVDPALRPFLDDSGLRDLTDEESQRYYDLSAEPAIPAEPLLMYALGAFWGEWLVTHAMAQWELENEVDPFEPASDTVIVFGFVHCALPWSHVVKKFIDPESDGIGDNAYFYSRVVHPIPLIAADSSADRAASQALPPAALAILDSGDAEAGFRNARQAVAVAGEDATVLFVASQAALGHDADAVIEWSRAYLARAAPHPVVLHNLAIHLWPRPDQRMEALALVDQALALDPDYALAHFNLAHWSAELGDTAKAKAEASLAAELDPGLEPDLQMLLR